ncbi:MAG: DUF3298 domain-containing protein [Flavonifractor plautii]
MKGLHTGTEKAAPAWKEWRREFCWEEEPVLAVSGVRLELPEGIPGLRRLERWCRRLEGAWAARWERELYPRACTAARQAREVSHPFRPWEASLTGAVTLHTPECLSLYYDAAERTGGPHGVTLRQGSAWALPGEPPDAGGAVSAGIPVEGMGAGGGGAAAPGSAVRGGSWFAPDWEARLPRSFDPERFYLTEAGPVIYFPLYSIAPYAEGIPAFSLAIPGQKENTPEE